MWFPLLITTAANSQTDINEQTGRFVVYALFPFNYHGYALKSDHRQE